MRPASQLKSKIEKAYNKLEALHKLRLEEQGVKLPRFKSGTRITKDAIVLAYLFTKLKKPVTKSELTRIVNIFYPGTTDVQQGRHLANGKGWNILSERRNDRGTERWPKDSYALISVSKPYPSFLPNRRAPLQDSTWIRIKRRFKNRCATCGSVENEKNLRNSNSRTKLERAHCDPTKPLTMDNCIPQCQECNRPARNYWVWDNKGRPKALADARIIKKSSTDVRKRVFEILHKEFKHK